MRHSRLREAVDEDLEQQFGAMAVAYPRTTPLTGGS